MPNCERWLWTPNCEWHTLNTKLWRYDGSEHQIESMALNTKLRTDIPESQTEKEWWWLWTPKLKVRLWTSNWKPMMALNAKTENATLNIKLGSNDDFERQNWECDSERQTEKWCLWTPKLRSGDGFEHRNWELTSLNVKLRRTTLNVKLRRNDDDSEPRNWKYHFEHQTKNQWWLWTPKLRMWLWTSN